ncbi:MAG: hypothetical protein AAFN77_03085 [Planctomycetota bacterium]
MNQRRIREEKHLVREGQRVLDDRENTFVPVALHLKHVYQWEGI